jgi:hypothetical protein
MAGVLIVLVAAMVVISFVIRKVSAPGTPVFAPGGQVVSGFPKELLLNHGAAFLNSYSINYSSSTDQYTAVWDTTSSVTDVYADYLSYFDRNGWVITKQIAQYPDSRGLFAAHGSSTASVAVSTHGTGSEVVVSYLPLSVPGTPAADDVLGRAPAGQLISEFLPGLVVDGNANIVDSFEGKSSGPNTRTFTTDYTSKLSVCSSVWYQHCSSPTGIF